MKLWIDYEIAPPSKEWVWAQSLGRADCDWLGCMADNWMDVAEYLRGKLDVFGLGGFDMEYCIDFFNQCCLALGGENEEYLLNKDGGSYYGR